ncbi:MAG: hypothetical protein ABIQ73_10600 [Acidimicrobiales bacterium]
MRLRRARSAISAELAVHRLAYLGVLLLFAGVTGLTVFSTGDVRRGLRPVAELTVPASLLFAAWFLRRRHSTVVATALEVLAATVLPIALLVSWVDGAAVPPDPGDGQRVAVLTATGAALTLAYAWYSRRRPISPWRFFVVPLGWLTVAALALVAADDVPSPDYIAVPVLWQWTIVLVAIAATAPIMRRFGPRIIAVAAEPELLPGAGVASVLVVVAAALDGWAEWPLTVAALALVMVFEYQRRWFRWATAPLQAAAFTAALAPLASMAGLGRVGVCGVVGALALLERTSRRGGDNIDQRVVQGTIAFLGGVVGLALAASAAESWTMGARRGGVPPWRADGVGRCGTRRRGLDARLPSGTPSRPIRLPMLRPPRGVPRTAPCATSSTPKRPRAVSVSRDRTARVWVI